MRSSAPYARIPGRRRDDRHARLEAALLLGLVEDVRHDAVLHAVARVEELDLAQDHRVRVLGGADGRDVHERRVPDEVHRRRVLPPRRLVDRPALVGPQGPLQLLALGRLHHGGRGLEPERRPTKHARTEPLRKTRIEQKNAEGTRHLPLVSKIGASAAGTAADASADRILTASSSSSVTSSIAFFGGRGLSTGSRAVFERLDTSCPDLTCASGLVSFSGLVTVGTKAQAPTARHNTTHDRAMLFPARRRSDGAGRLRAAR